MTESNIVAIETKRADRVRPLPPTLAEDVLDLASGLAELVQAVRTLAERVADIEKDRATRN